MDVLINPQTVTVRNKLRVFLQTPTKYHHLVFAGHAIQGSGDWILQDNIFTLHQLVTIAKEADVEAALKQKAGSQVTIFTHAEGHWNTTHFAKESLGKVLKVSVNPDCNVDDISGINNFSVYVGNCIKSRSPRELLQSSDVVGNIRFSRPTFYIFPGSQGDSALFGISGFNLLVNGGYSRKSCFWDFTRHLDRIDAMVLTHLGVDNLFGASTMLERKSSESIHPEIGHIYFNASDKVKHSPNGDANPENGGSHKPASLLVNLVEEGERMTENMRIMGLHPHPCTGTISGQTIQPINLYHKVGQGSLNMYILNPMQDSKELKDFFIQWNKHVNNFTNSKIKLNGKDATIPLPNMVSIAALLVWRPSNPNEKINRILFPGSTPQNKLFEGMDKMKNQDIFQHAEVTEKILHCPKGAKKATVGKPKPGVRGSPPLSKVEPKRRAATPTKPDKPTKDIKNKKVSISRSSKASSTTGSTASAATPTATPVSSVDVSPTKEPAPEIVVPAVAATEAVIEATSPPAADPVVEDKANPTDEQPPEVPVGIQRESNLMDFASEEPKEQHDISPEPVTASLSDKSPDLPPEPPSADLLDLHISGTKQDSAPEDQPEADLLGMSSELVSAVQNQTAVQPESQMLELSKPIDVTEQASMPEADQEPPQELTPPAVDAQMESPEPLPDPAHYETENFNNIEAEKPESEPVQRILEPEGMQSDLVQDVYKQEEVLVEAQREPDLLSDKRQDLMETSPEAERDMTGEFDSKPHMLDDFGSSALQPDLIPKESDAIGKEEEEVEKPVEDIAICEDNQVSSILEQAAQAEEGSKAFAQVDDEKDIDTTELPTVAPDEIEIAEMRDRQELEQQEPEKAVSHENIPPEATSPEVMDSDPFCTENAAEVSDSVPANICDVDEQISQEAYRQKLSDLGIYDDESELPNGDTSPGTTPTAEQVAESVPVAGSPAEDSGVFGGERPIGLPSPEEPPVELMEPETEQEQIEFNQSKPLLDIGSHQEQEIVEDPADNVMNKSSTEEVDSKTEQELVEPEELHDTPATEEKDTEQDIKSAENEDVGGDVQELPQEMSTIQADDMIQTEEKEELEQKQDEEKPFASLEQAQPPEDEIKTMDQLYDQIRQNQGIKEPSPEVDEFDRDLHAEAVGSADGSSLVDSTPDVYEVQEVQKMELGDDFANNDSAAESDDMEEFEQLEGQISEAPGIVDDVCMTSDPRLSDQEEPENAQEESSLLEPNPLLEEPKLDPVDTTTEERLEESAEQAAEEPEITTEGSEMLLKQDQADQGHSSHGFTEDSLADSLYEPPELQPQPEPQKPDLDMLDDMPTFATDSFNLVDSPHEDTNSCNPNPFINLDNNLVAPQTIPEDKVEPEEAVERDSLERDQADGFDPLQNWGQPLGLPAPPPPGGSKDVSKDKTPKPKLNGVSKTGAGAKPASATRKPGTSPMKKPGSATNKDAGLKTATKPQTKAAVEPKKTAAAPKPTKEPVKKPPAGAPKKTRPVSAPVPPKDDSKPSKAGVKKPASAPATKAAPPAKPLAPVTPFYVDLTYIPHHGDAHYVDLDYFRRVRARYYVLSALDNTAHVLNALLEGKQTWENGDAEVTVIPTYDTDTLRSWMVLNRDQLSQLKIDVAPSASRCTIQLQDHETSCFAFRLEF